MPAKGYHLFWRLAGSFGPYTNAGSFFNTPAVFTDNSLPGTEYEGFIRSENRGSICNEISWSTIVQSGIIDSGSGGGGIGFFFPNSGRGNSSGAACADAVANNRVFWSYCAVIEVGCRIYTDHNLNNPLTGYSNLFIDNTNWDINPTTAILEGYSAIQC